MRIDRVKTGAGRTMESLPASSTRPSRAIPDALVISQSGGPTAVINASLVGAVRTALASDQVGGLYGARYGIRGVLDRDLLDLRAEPPGTWDALLRTPSAALGACRFRLDDDTTLQALDGLRALGARYFIYIGGNDSADTAHRLAQAARAAGYDLRIICGPNTLDNNLPPPAHCPCYASAPPSPPAP